MPALRIRLALRIAGLVVACVGAFWQLSLLVRLFLGRVLYPWDVEWLESTVLYQAYRVAKGLYVYGPLKDGYIALIQPPGYPLFIGLVGKVIGVDYAMGRTISMLFFVGAAVLVARALVRHQEGRVEGWALGAFAIGCAAAGVPVIESFYSIVRNDAMALFLALTCAALVENQVEMKPRRIALVAVLITGLVFTRLPTIFLPAWVVLFAFFRDRRSGFFLALTTTALCGLLVVILQFSSKGWYWMLTVALVQEQHIAADRFRLGLEILQKHAPFFIAIPVATVVLAALRRISASTVLWVGLLAASIPASLLPFAKVGGFSNDFMPTVFLFGPVAAFLCSDLFNALARHPRAQIGVALPLFGAMSAFLLVRTYDFKPFLPSPDHFRRAAALNTTIASLDGGVLYPRHPFTPTHNGKPTLQWSEMPYLDLLWSGYRDVALGRYIDESEAKWAVISGTELPLTKEELSARFELAGPVGEAPMTLIGEHSQARHLLRRHEPEKDPRVLFDFEKDLEGWTQTGDTFRITPVQPDWQQPIIGAVGAQVVNSYHPVRRDGATGTLTSPKFIIDRPRLGLRVGGGWRDGTRVELLVDGRLERRAHGIFEESEAMIKVVWDVAPFMGKEAQLVLVDAETGSWAHLTVDHVVLY